MQSWDHEADIVIVGYGGAAAAAALTARRMGQSVIVIEKQAAGRHTPSTRMSGGLIMAATDAGKAAQYLDQCAGGMVPMSLSRVWGQRCTTLIAWLNEVCPGLDLAKIGGAEHRALAGADTMEVYQPGGAKFRLDPDAGSGRMLFAALAAAVDKAGARVLWETPAQRLIRSGARGVVEGVEAVSGGKTVRVRGRKGVVLACGGFEFDEPTKRDFLRAYPMYFYGNPGNTGDGLRMAQEVGAGLWHMNQMVGRAIGRWELPDGSSLAFIIVIGPPGYVITDRYGKRFANETMQAQLLHGFYYKLLDYDPDKGIYPRVPCYWFFDEKRRKAGPLTLLNLGVCSVGLYDWSPDNSREIDSGWILKGNSIAEVAAAAGIEDAAAAEASVHAHNQACRNGTPDAYERPRETMIPLEGPPYYCVKLWPGGSNTTGGPQRDEHARVLDVFGAPIPGLYCAGELGQPSGMQYPADGSNLSEAFAFGQIAVEEIVAAAGR